MVQEVKWSGPLQWSVHFRYLYPHQLAHCITFPLLSCLAFPRPESRAVAQEKGGGEKLIRLLESPLAAVKPGPVVVETYFLGLSYII